MEYWNNQKAFTVNEVAEKLGKHRITILRWIENNKIEAYKPFNCWLILESEIERIQKEGWIN